MKTPEEIKKGLECCADYGNCSTEGCPYEPIKDCGHDLYSDALAYIQQLERERDAAVEDLKRHGSFCSTCLHDPKFIYEEPCATCSKLSTANEHLNWQWRGVQEVE